MREMGGMGPGGPPRMPQVQITPEMVKNAKTLTCDCGGMIFESGMVIKKISALVSPSGMEMEIPIQVLICKNCGLIPREMDPDNVLPEELKCKPKS